MPHRAIVCELVAANPGRFNYPKRELERWKCRQVAFSEDSILPGTIACNAATRDPRPLVGAWEALRLALSNTSRLPSPSPTTSWTLPLFPTLSIPFGTRARRPFLVR